MRIRVSGSTALLCCLVIAIPAAHADLISVNYTGIATSGGYPGAGGGTYPPPAGPDPSLVDLTGSTVTGTIVIQPLSNTPGTFVLPGESITGLAQGSMTLTYDFALVGRTYSSYNASPVLTLTDDGTTQVAYLEPDGSVGGDVVTLTGPEASLFSSVADVSTLHVGSGVVLGSLSTRLNQRQLPAINIGVTSFASVPGTAIPEPGSWALLGTCLAALAMMLGVSRHGAKPAKEAFFAA